MKKILTLMFLLAVTSMMSAKDYYVSPTGSDANNGSTRNLAFATLGKAQSVVKAGDKVYILPGTYAITEEQISATSDPYKIVFNFNQNGQAGKPISFIGLTENSQRPVFDMSAVNPSGFRVTAFYVTGSYLVFRNFEVVGVQVNITSHTQSENFRIRNGHHNTFENIACHDGMGIGFYLTNKSHHNLFLNCDGYNNYDSVSESGKGGQNDGFGCHVEAGQEANIFIGCRAWNNSDDGYDLINCYSPVTFCYSIAYKNGYDADGTARQDGNGFKAGGYGMSATAITLPSDGAPRHKVYHCLAIQNKSNGIYSNHHLGGVDFTYNTVVDSRYYSNFSMVNRKGAAASENQDVNGYNHKLENNLSISQWDRHIGSIDAADESNSVKGNSFTWNGSEWVNNYTATFINTNVDRLKRVRLDDGMLNPATTLTVYQQTEYTGMGCDFSGYEAAVTEARKTSGAEIEKYSQTNVSVFLTAGQSNTAGRCMNENLPDYIKALGSTYQYCNWSYTNGSTRKSESEGVFRKFWPEMESTNNAGRFAYDAIVYYWLEQALQQDFYVVKHAAGGTSIDPACTSTNDYHWSADATWLAEHASCNEEGGTSMLKALCSNIGKTIDALAADGKSADIKALLWHQGESDRSGTGPDNYYANLKAVVQYVRDYLVSKTGDEKYATLDIICGTVPPQSKQYNKKVYDALFTLAGEDSHFHVVKTEPGTFIGDDLHFDANCAERLGINMYNKMVDLGLVDGEKQTVPEAIVPEQTTITLDFTTWTKDNIAAASTYAKLTAEATSSLTTIDGQTALYKIIGSEADGDFSEFAETFALATPANIQLRGAGHGLFANKKQSILSLLNLEAGDRVTITTKAGDGGNSLVFVSTNAYKDGDASKTAVTTETEWVSGESYVITANTQLDLLFGRTATTCYIYKVVIEKGAVEITEPTDPTDEPTKKVTVHTIGDSTMSSYDQSIPAQKGMDGWGDYLVDCMKSNWTTVNNWADRGETARSYYNGIWLKTSSDRPEFAEPVMNKVQEGDYVIIQFGHNDSKAYSTVKYEEWLSTLVDAVKAKGATPIIASSICRARFGSDGKITRLGRIDTYEDSNRILEDGASVDDYTFDYPYHAQQVALAKGVEFIDVTSGVKELFETYGEAKTKALFPTGEKTHTNKLGAQLIAKVAAKLLLNTALKNYVNTEALTLPSADDIDVIIDDFKGEAVVTKKTIWTFNDYQDGDVIAAASESENNVVELNGLYARSWTSRAINAVTSPLSKVTFSDADATTVDVSIAAFTTSNQASGANIFGQNTAGRVGASGLAPTFALNVGTPGTFYCILAPTKNNSERSERIIFSGKEVVAFPVSEAYANTDHLCEIKYHAENTGVIYVSAGITSNFYAMMFIPDMEAGTEEDWNYQMLLTRDDGYWTYTNMSGSDQQVPEGLTAYAVSSVENDAAVLTDIGSVIPNGVGVVVKGEPNTEYALPVAATTSGYSGSNLLVGNTELRYLPATEANKTNYYFDGQKFVKATGGETIHEKQAYLCVDSNAETLPLTIGGTTGISASLVNSEKRKEERGERRVNSDVFDLQGRRVAQPVKGIYVCNGRKYVVR